MRDRKPSSSKSQHDYADASRGERLQKVLAAAGIASRRDCEVLITQGLVKVNGQTVQSLPAWVDAEKDHIEVEGRPIARHRKATGAAGKHKHVYVALHKPREVIATTSDEFGRTNVVDLVDLPPLSDGDKPPRLYPVGRLDADSTGLILLTNDGDLAHRLTHPSFQVAKEYEVSVKGKVSEDDLHRLHEGLAGARRGEKARKAVAKKQKFADARILGTKHDEEHGDRTTILITLEEGPDREVKWVLKRMGFTVRRVKRTAIGPIRLKGLSLRGWRMLTGAEVNQLRRAVGLG